MPLEIGERRKKFVIGGGGGEVAAQDGLKVTYGGDTLGFYRVNGPDGAVLAQGAMPRRGTQTKVPYDMLIRSQERGQPPTPVTRYLTLKRI